mgnify:FL=1
MKSKQMIAIVAIVVIAVAGIAAVALMGDDGDDKKTAKTDYGSSMTVFGNANMDSVIDESDIQYVKDVIAGTAEKTAFCDANHDGEVNEKDIDYIRDLIDRKDGTTVWYVDGSGEEMSAEWPLNTFVVLSNSPQLMALAVGLDDSKIIGYTKADKIVFKSFEKAKLLSSSSLTDYTVMTSNGIPDAIITQGTPTDPVDPSVRATYAKMGTDIICVAGMDGDKSASSALTLGFLVGGIEKSQQYSKWCIDMLADVEKKVSTVPDEKRKTALVWFGGHAAAGYDNDYTKALETAGGKTLADWTGYRVLNADNCTWVLNYDPEFMIRIFTTGYASTPESRQALFEKYGAMIDQMNAYKNEKYCLIDFTIPQTLRIAYMAEFMYPELFGEGYADGWHQKLVDIYGIDYKVDGQFMFTFKDLKK